MKYAYGAKIVKGGMGGFLCPPGHPMHEWSVETGKIGNPNGCYSLDAAVKAEYLPPAIRGRASGMLKRWAANRHHIDNSPVREWIAQVLGYFKGCYAGQDDQGKQSWNASQLRIDATIDPLLNADLHAGVHCIREYYPEFMPTAEHFAGAYWGTKPEKAIA